MNELQVYQTVLNSWKQDYELLHDILNSEQRALEKRVFDQLVQLVKEKDAAVKRINSHQVPPIINAQGVNNTSLNEFKKFCSRNPALAESWTELMQLVEKCCFKNEVNARLIDLLNHSSQRTFNLIKGCDPDNNIYNSQGNRTTVRHFSSSLSA